MAQTETLLRKVMRQLSVESRDLLEESLRRFKTKYNMTPENLRRALEDPVEDEHLRAFAAWTIGAIRDLSFAGILENLLRTEPPSELLWEVTKALCSLRQGEEVFRSMLGAIRPENRSAAAYGLGHLSAKSAVRDLSRLLLAPQEDPKVRGHAAEALGNIAAPEALEPLLEATYDPSVEVRFWSTFALGNIGGPRAVRRLQELTLTDSEILDGWWTVSEEAAAALEKLRRQ